MGMLVLTKWILWKLCIVVYVFKFRFKFCLRGLRGTVCSFRCFFCKWDKWVGGWDIDRDIDIYIYIYRWRESVCERK